MGAFFWRNTVHAYPPVSLRRMNIIFEESTQLLLFSFRQFQITTYRIIFSHWNGLRSILRENTSFQLVCCVDHLFIFRYDYYNFFFQPKALLRIDLCIK